MAPVPIMDCTITNETVHLRYPNNPSEFWNENEGDKTMPNYREYEEWLKDNDIKMNLRL